MKAIKKRFTVMIMAVVLAITGIVAVGGVGRDKSSEANALSPEYFAGFDTIYYFSDSDPTFKSLAYLNGYNTVFDVKYFLTPEALEYMIYTGYFWGFVYEYSRPIVIVEIKTMVPDLNVLIALTDCLHAQGCKVMLISPYIDVIDGINAEIVMRCNPDKEYKFLENSVKAMSDDQGVVYNDTTLLLDGRMIGAYGAYDVIEGYAFSPYLRALLMNMRYGYYPYNVREYEYNLFVRLWQVYMDVVMLNYGFELNYFEGETNIENYIDMWRYIGEEEPNLINDMWQGKNEEYNERCKEELNIYFKEDIAAYLVENNIHILVNVYNDGITNFYIDIIHSVAENYYEVYEFVFSNEQQFGNAIYFNIAYLYGMGQWQLESDFYSLLYSLQNNLDYLNKIVNEMNDYKFRIERLPVFIWEVDPIEWGSGGLEIITSDKLAYMYDDESEEIDEEVLIDMFTSYLHELEMM